MTTDLLNGIQALKTSLKGDVVLPADPAYDRVRQIWNAMIDRRPAAIVRCAAASDVGPALRFAQAQGLEVSIRGGGHNIAGTSLCDGGLLIDMSGMRTVRIDAGTRRASVAPGATLREVDAPAQAHGLATPIGINSTTGIAGLTLGGGFGWLTRKHGLTIDNLVAADVVVADGTMRHASADHDADLFWAIRGGGGNFGVVTQFEFALHQAGPKVLGGLLVFPFDDGRRVLEQYRDFVQGAPEDLNAWVVLRKAPPLPFLPADVHGREVVVLAVFYDGDLSEGEKQIDRLRRFGPRLGEHVGAQPYVAWQQAFDPLLTPGARNYWKSHNFTELGDGAIGALVEYASRLPSDHCEIFVALISGAANRVPAHATAYAHRDAKLVVNVHARWEHVGDDSACIAWARDFYKASAPYASAGGYVNFMTADERERVPDAYGSNFERLVQMKRRYDPTNVFHWNQNIVP